MGPEEYYGQQPANYAQPADPNKKKRIIIAAGGLGVFLILVIIILGVLLSTPSIRPQVVKIAAMHQELARVAELGLDSDDGRRSTQELAANVRVSSLAAVSEISSWGSGKLAPPITPATLETEENTNTDAALLQAGEVNNYDEVFKDAMLNLMNAINNQIIQDFDTFADQKELQDILNLAGENNKILIESIEN